MQEVGSPPLLASRSRPCGTSLVVGHFPRGCLEGGAEQVQELKGGCKEHLLQTPEKNPFTPFFNRLA